jgi:hypothetical protein
MPNVIRTVAAIVCLMAVSLTGSAIAEIWPDTVPSFKHIGREGITERQADYIAALVAQHEGYRVWEQYSSIEGLNVYPGYFYVRITFDMPNYAFEYSPRYYFISKMTGDVWQSHIPGALYCYRVSFPALRAVQRKIMKKTSLNFAKEKSLRKGIYCADG